MNRSNDDVRSLLPDWLNGTLSEAERGLVSDALSANEELRAETEFLRGLQRARPEPSPALAGRVRSAVEAAQTSRPRSRGRRVVWQLSAAATVILATGTVAVLARGGESLPDLEALPRSWMMDDAVVAGGLVLDGLPEEALNTLVAELER